ncbi:HIRAN domain-containing protein [Clostridium weizhouense]|uniref:HIRAN domain-containing protein n=1 Tax=Clostridium weizhouense TaxID=2859781 RepID=A0ABS7ARD1_9CLOT|nr:HIRAN domain-containing protein [Clostridium weizhouense]MBW6410040.1 HIRAN domain-containing protein [Clostridium weizhouense]
MCNINVDNLIESRESIYKELEEFYYKNLGIPYSYQDFQVAGLNEFNVAFNKIKPLEIYDQIRLANELINNLLSYNRDNKKEVLENIKGYLTLNPIINYYNAFLRNFRAIYEENEDYKENLINIIESLLYEGDVSEEIKLSLIMQCVIKLDKTDKILKVLSINNEYIFYIIKVYESMKNSNKNIFKLAKKSNGYAKAVCVQALQPSNNDIKEWLIQESLEDNLGDIECLPYTILALDILKYLKSGKVNTDNLQSMSKWISLLFSEYSIDSINDGLEICIEFLKNVDEHARDIYSLYATTSIVYAIDSFILDEYEIYDTEDIYSLSPQYKNIITLANRIYKKSSWRDIILDEIGNIELDTEIIISSLEKTNIRLKKREFELLIKRDNTNPNLYRYAFERGSKAIKQIAIKLAYEKLEFKNILNINKNIKLDELSIEQINHICFYFLVKGIKYEEFPEKYKKINLAALKASLIETRTQAIRNLTLIKENFDLNDINIVEEAIINEKIASLKTYLKSLIGRSYQKKKEYVITEDVKIIPHVKDIYIISTEISGIRYVDLSEVYDVLREGQIVYLNREKENIYDENAIQIVTSKGYVIGYVPQNNNLILKNLIDNGKYLYGIINKLSYNYEDIKINVYLSYKDVINEITTTLSLLSNRDTEYIQ